MYAIHIAGPDSRLTVGDIALSLNGMRIGSIKTALALAKVFNNCFHPFMFSFKVDSHLG